ncbi:MYG1 family protein, partial [Rhizobium ruizarguesonis]
VLPIDLTDNGAFSPSGPLAGLTLPSLLETLKPVFDETAPDADDLACPAASIARCTIASARNFAALWAILASTKLRAMARA